MSKKTNKAKAPTKAKATKEVKETQPTALKRRSAEPVKAAKVLKPRKMKLLKPRRIEGTNTFGNAGLLTFPTDRLGLTSETKAALIRAASRMGTDERNYNLLVETVDVLMKHVEARLEQNKETRTLKPRVDTKALSAKLEKEAEQTK